MKCYKWYHQHKTKTILSFYETVVFKLLYLHYHYKITLLNLNMTSKPWPNLKWVQGIVQRSKSSHVILNTSIQCQLLYKKQWGKHHMSNTDQGNLTLPWLFNLNEVPFNETSFKAQHINSWLPLTIFYPIATYPCCTTLETLLQKKYNYLLEKHASCPQASQMIIKRG